VAAIEEFGRYVVVWTVACSSKPFQTSLVTTPCRRLSAAWPPQPATHRYRRLWVVIASASGAACCSAGARSLIRMVPNYAGPLFVLALVNPLQRLYLFFRRLCYIRDRQFRRRGGSARLWRRFVWRVSRSPISTPSRSAPR